jgi:hypothetical protein
VVCPNLWATAPPLVSNAVEEEDGDPVATDTGSATSSSTGEERRSLGKTPMVRGPVAGVAAGVAAGVVGGTSAAVDDEEDEGDEEDERKARQEATRHFAPVFSRWYGPGNPVYLDLGREELVPLEEGEYEINERASWWNPYYQNKLKGDFPIIGEDIFLNIILTDRLIYESRLTPTRSGITGPGPVAPGFFGDGHQDFWINDTVVTFDVFKGHQAFKPVDWRVRISPVYNHNELYVEEEGVTNIDVRHGRNRQKDDIALQEALLEYHLFDLTDRYDFVSSEIGIFPFRSDFRGFIFDDINLGVRIFGNYDDNKWQYNLAAFDMRDKDTNSLLNNSDDREQEVIIANVYRQDWPVKGFITSFSVHYNNDHRGTHFNDNGFLISPAPVGLAQEHELESFYLGWAGEGHLGRFNVTHALYQVFGEDQDNPFAGRDVDINAQFGAIEVSYDIDWWRPRAYAMYASGDDDARDGDANGFDAILDAANFAGGPLSFFNNQAINLTGVNLTNFQSFLPDLQTSKFEGHSNFVNPGLLLLGGAVDVEITPTTRSQIGFNYLRFQESATLETFLELPDIEKEIGTEIYFGLQYRPLFNNHVLLGVGTSILFPSDGYARIYQTDEPQYQNFFNVTVTW